jgi:hypothetical protein
MDMFPPLQAACLPAGARSGLLRKLGRSGLRGQMLEAMKKLKTYL